MEVQGELIIQIFVGVALFFLIGKVADALKPLIVRYHLRDPKTPSDYLSKLCVIKDLTQPEVFHIAAREMGFGFTDEKVNGDYFDYYRTKKLPHYVVTFIEEGKEYIDAVEL